MSDFKITLAEIVDRVKIDPDLTLNCADYPPLSPVTQVAARIKHAPRDIQAKYIVEQLQFYLASIYFQRSLLSVSANLDKQCPDSLTSTQLVTNNSSSGFNTVFYNRVVQANQGRGYYDPGWLIESVEMSERIVVVKDGLHLHLRRTAINLPHQNAKIGQRVAILLPKNIITRSRYIAIGNRGRVNSRSIVNIYFNSPTTTTEQLTTQLTIELNQTNLAFELQIDPNPERHHRCETVILSLAKSDYLAAYPALLKVYHSIGTTFRPSTPFATKVLAPGIAAAEVYTTNEDDGNHHCGAISFALAQAWMLGITSSTNKLDLIQATLDNAGINRNQPYLLDTEEQPSIDIYQVIE